MNMAAFGGAFRSLTSSGANLLAMVNQIADALGRVNYTLQSLRAADYGSKITADFSNLRNIFRDMRGDIQGVSSGLREMASQVGRAATTATRVRTTRAAPAGGGVAAPEQEQMTRALVVQQNQYLTMAQERARMIAQVSAQEAQARQTEMQAQAQMLTQVQAFQQARVAAANAAAVAEETAAQQSMLARIAAERAAQAAYVQTQAMRTQQIAEVAAVEEAARQKEIQDAGAMYMRLRGFQQAHVQAVEDAARREEMIIQRTLQARLRAAEQWRTVNRQQPLALPPGRDPAQFFGAQAFERLSRPQRIQIPERAGPTVFAEGAFGGAGAAEGARRMYGGLEEVNKSLDKTSGALANTKTKKDALDKNLKDTAQNTLPKFNTAWLSVIGVMALFQVRRIIGELEELGKSLFNTGVEFEKAFALMKAGAGDNADEAARRMQVMADLARKLGLDYAQLIVDSGKVYAAAKGSDIEGAKAEAMVTNLASAMAVFGQQTEKGSGLIKVFTDVLSKGRLQSEELVKQLGNAVPGAFRVVAQSLNMTTTELQDAVAKGSLSATSVLIRLAEELNKIYGAEALNNVNRLSGAFNGLKQSLTEVALLIVNMATGVMSGSGSTFGKTLVQTFQQLSALLQNREIQTRIVELANFITHVLSVAFQGLIAILRFATEHMYAFVAAITALTSAAIYAGVVALTVALGKLFNTILVFASSPKGLAVLAVGFGLSLVAAKLMADEFNKSLEGVAESVGKMYDEIEKRRAKTAPDNQNPADQTRAVQEALNRVEREQRSFVEGVRNEAQMLELAASGVSTLSARYEAYLRVLERIKAQEVKELFDILKPGDAATMKRRLTEALLQAEQVKQAIGDIVEMFKALDQAQEEFSQAHMSMTESLRAVSAGTFTEAGQQIQQQYDQKVLPVMRRVREELRYIADPSLRSTLVGTFNAFSEAMRDNIVQLKVMQGIMGGIGEITRSLQDFRLEKMTTDLMRTVKDGQVFVDTTTTGMSEAVKSMLQEGFPDLKPPNVRSLGEELSVGFNPAEVGRDMGLTFTEVFVRGMEASVQKIIDQMKALAAPPTTGGGGTGGPYLEQAGQHKGVLEKAGGQYNVDPEFLARIAKFESNFDASAKAYDERGRLAGQGLMQIVTNTQRHLGVKDPFDPEQSAMGGAKYIDELLRKHSGNLERALRDYRGVGPEKDPKYFENILGGYTGTGRITGGTAVAAVPRQKSELELAAEAGKAQAAAAAAAQAGTKASVPASYPPQELGRTNFWDTLWSGLSKIGSAVSGTAGSVAIQVPEQKRYVPGEAGAPQPAGPAVPGAITTPVAPPEVPVSGPHGTVASTEERAKATAEETKAIRDQVEAIRQRNEATQRATEAQDRMHAQTEKQKKDLQDLQVDIDRATAFLDKQTISTTNLGVVKTSDATRARAQAEGDRLATQARRQYVGITDQMLEQIAKIGQAKVYNQAIQQGDEFTKSIERQTKAIRDETAALAESPLTKEASAQARQRQRELETSNEAFDPAALEKRQKAIVDERTSTVDKSVQTYLEGSQKEQRMLQMEIESLNDNTIARAANLEMRKQNDELLRNAAGLSDEQKRRILEQNEALRRTRIAQQQANGPLRQYIDSLADLSDEATISNAIQERTAELFSSLEDEIINFTKTGKFNFRDFADSFIEQIQRMVLQALIFRPIAEALNQALSGTPGQGTPPAGGGGGGWASTLFNVAKLGLSIFSATQGGPGGAGAPGSVAYNYNADLNMLSAVGGVVTARGIEHPQMYAGGGVVPGGEAPLNTFQGGGMQGVGSDTVPAILTPGEVVLNRAQQDAIVGSMTGTQNNTFNMVFPNVSNQDQARQTAAQAYSEISSRLERQRVRDGVRARR